MYTQYKAQCRSQNAQNPLIEGVIAYLVQWRDCIPSCLASLKKQVVCTSKGWTPNMVQIFTAICLISLGGETHKECRNPLMAPLARGLMRIHMLAARWAYHRIDPQGMGTSKWSQHCGPPMTVYIWRLETKNRGHIGGLHG